MGITVSIYRRTIRHGGHAATMMSAGVEWMEGLPGIRDQRYVNAFGTYRRITGEAVDAILAECKRRKAVLTQGIVGHGGRMDWHVYEGVPVAVLDAIDPRPERFEQVQYWPDAEA